MQGRWCGLCLGVGATWAVACVDELVEDVPEPVCFSGQRWIGGKHGHPDMYPGRDCVGCHEDNDGPQLVLGGTVYAYVVGRPDIFAAQSGTDCFGMPGVTVRIRDDDEQVFDLVTNQAGNFYIEGDPHDFAKPFSAEVRWIADDGMERISPMYSTHPQYGGCAHCHDPTVLPALEAGLLYETEPRDAEYQNGQPRIGLPGYRDAQVRALASGVAP